MDVRELVQNRNDAGDALVNDPKFKYVTKDATVIRAAAAAATMCLLYIYLILCRCHVPFKFHREFVISRHHF